MKNIGKAGLGLLGVFALVLVQAGAAHADAQPRPTDVVGVGSDTAQYAVGFGLDGDTAGNSGYNTANTARRGFSFDATGDANGRTASVLGTPAGATTVLRAGQAPVVRPNGSGAGITALINDCKLQAGQPAGGLCEDASTAVPTAEVVNFVRASRLPTAAEQSAATAHGWGGLHVYQFADDRLKVAVSNLVATNAPAALSIDDLVHIYKGDYLTWNQVPGYAGPAPTGAIKPYSPQAGSGTRSFFDAQLKAANGGVAVTYGSNVTLSEEHDAGPIQSDPNAIGPFSVPRLSLLNSGYFGAGLVNVVHTLDGTNTFDVTRGLFIIVRDRDVADHTANGSGLGKSGIVFPWKVGGTQNWVEVLFNGGLSWFGRSTNKAAIESSGVAWHYVDQGLASSG